MLCEVNCVFTGHVGRNNHGVGSFRNLGVGRKIILKSGRRERGCGERNGLNCKVCGVAEDSSLLRPVTVCQ